MSITSILALAAVALFFALVRSERWRVYLLMGASALVVYAFQPTLPVRFLDFWLPTATLALVALAWALTVLPVQRAWKTNWKSGVILGALILAVGLTRYIEIPFLSFHPPQIWQIIIALAITGLLAFLLMRLNFAYKMLLPTAFILIIAVFIVLKTPALAQMASAGLRALNRQATITASALDLRWLGFSYIAFRILHTIRDRQSGRLPAVSLAEYMTYVIFFPSLSAGPIDRIERFITDLRRPSTLAAEDWGTAGKRITIGLFKKFVLADALALIALNGTNALQVRTGGWAWVLLYAYTFQIYFDFSGYTDIAIGLGRLLGFKLPENFNAPYLKPNITQFWNNWHMTLTQWFRAYFFNPLTRALRSSKRSLPVPVIIFTTQLATMLLIGFWHGITWNFILWGLWHGLGLFFHNRWNAWTRARFAALSLRLQSALNIGGTLLTFHFVALGWVFFSLPDPAASLHLFLKLFGLS